MSSTASARDRRGFLAGAGAALLAGCARGAAPVVTEPAERAVTVGGARIGAITAGRGRPVVLLHGASGNARDWTFGALQALAQRHAVIAFHRPGLGGSDIVPGHERLDVQARTLAAALDALGGRAPVLVGHSYGGAVALAWALARPDSVRGVVLLGAPSQVWPGGMGMTTELLAGPLTGPVLAAVAPFVPRSLAEAAVARIFAPQEAPEAYLDRLGLAQVLSPAALRANARQLASLKEGIAAMVPRYASLPMPVEILHGDRDGVVPIGIHAGPLAAMVPRARLTVLPGIGHMPHHAARPAVLEAVQRAGA